MKKIVFVLIILSSTLSLHAQKKSGVIYSEHELIDKTKSMWTALADGNVDKALSFFADSVYFTMNGDNYPVAVTGTQLKQFISGWSRLPNLKVSDDTPAYPDAMEYSKGFTWVQDWIRLSGRDNKTGLNYDVPVHNLYLFNKEGKIAVISHYLDNSLFDELSNSYETKENGVVYINHEYINTVRKMINAMCEEDLDSVLTFYAPTASFYNSTLNWGETENLESYKNHLKKEFEDLEDIKIKQVGYPDCVHYEKDDNYTVYSWWIYSAKYADDGKVIQVPFMNSAQFNKDGKITYQNDYYSTNHLE